MSERADPDFIADITEATKRIISYTGGMGYEEFLNDNKTQDTVVRNLEIIGEATKNLSDNFKKQQTHIPWKNMAAIRDRLIHHYFGVNYDILWEIIRNELPEILRILETKPKG